MWKYSPLKTLGPMVFAFALAMDGIYACST